MSLVVVSNHLELDRQITRQSTSTARNDAGTHVDPAGSPTRTLQPPAGSSSSPSATAAAGTAPAATSSPDAAAAAALDAVPHSQQRTLPDRTPGSGHKGTGRAQTGASRVESRGTAGRGIETAVVAVERSGDAVVVAAVGWVVREALRRRRISEGTLRTRRLRTGCNGARGTTCGLVDCRAPEEGGWPERCGRASMSRGYFASVP
jgi:hypothetical protein